MRFLKRPSALFLSLGLLGGFASSAGATPQFARQYRVDCTACHSSPPRLNEAGLAFVAAGYRFPGREPVRTVPLALWHTADLEWRHSGDLLKGFPSRVELIAAGAIGRTRAAYFAEWRAVSLSLDGSGRINNRSGRFEDLFVRVPFGSGSEGALTVGQFRALSQVDVSLRLSLSEPLVFSSSLPGATSPDARRTGLRAFSASGRQPAIRAEYQLTGGRSPADGWFAAATLPLTGEWTIPLGDAASFEFDPQPKGVFVETYRRAGLTTIGAHGFVGDERRRLLTAVVTRHVADRIALLAGIGTFHVRGTRDTRFSIGAEATVSPRLVGGIRVDHRTRQGRDPIVVLYGNQHLPFGPRAFRQALRLQLEHRIQPANHTTTLALSHVF